MTGTEDARAARVSARSWRRGGVGLIILCLLVFIPGLWTIPPVDRDESRFAQASRQMLESGTLEGWVVPKVQDKPRLNKPPLIYWLQASSARILGDAPGQWSWLDGGSENIWVYRVPSVLSAMAAVLLTWRLGVRMFDPRAAWLGAALLAVCPMVVWDAHQARADQLLLATTTGTMLALWSVWRLSSSPSGRGNVAAKRRRGEGVRRTTYWAWPVGFWLALSLGIMTKGPITPMVAALTCVALSLVSRQWKWLLQLRPVLGVLIVGAVVGPWVYLVGQEVGWSKYLSIVYDETIGRSAGAKEGHWGPPGYHIVLLGVLFWPGSLLTAAAIARAWRRGLHRSQLAPAQSRLARVWQSLRDARPSRPAELFLLAWMLPSWIVFELISTKLPHYTMPLYPAVALMSARALFGVKAMFLPSLGGTQRQRLAAFLANRDVKCPRCRYNLRGLTIPNCPECNTEIRVSRSERLTTGYGSDRSQRGGRLIWMIFGVAIGIGIPLAATLEGITPEGNDFPLSWSTRFVLAGGACISISALLINWAVNCLRRNNVVGATLVAMAISVSTFGIIFSTLLHRLDSLWISRSIVAVLHDREWTPSMPIACVGYTEDSLIFLTRGRIARLPDAESVIAWFSLHDVSVVVSDRLRTYEIYMKRSRAAANQPSLQPPYGWMWAEIRGLNYSTGDHESLTIEEYRR